MKKLIFILVLSLANLAASYAQNNFTTSGNQILDPCGEPFIIRGVNYSLADDWNFPQNISDNRERSSQIIQANPNTVRIQWYVNYGNTQRPALTLVGLDSVITRFKRQNIVSMLELHDFTHIHTDTTAFNNQIVQWWTSPEVLELIDKHQTHLLINIANEYGPAMYPAPTYTLNPNYNAQVLVWAQHYKSVITQLRNAGITLPLVIDAPNYGGDYQAILDHGSAFNLHDPLRRIIGSVHAYWGDNVSTVTQKVNDLAQSTIPVFLGEIGNRDFACLPIEMNAILTAAHANNMGWLAWTWNRDNCADRNLTANHTQWNSTTDGLFSQLTAYGQIIVNNADVGLAAHAQKANFDCELGIANIESYVNVYPNPLKNFVNVEWKGTQPLTKAMILDTQGKLIMQTNASEQQTNIKINTQNLQPGIYFLQVQAGEKIEVIKIVKH